jgi:hypothetical protein
MGYLLRHRLVVCYAILAFGALLFFLRRLLLPSFFELEGVPFTIAAPSILNSCYSAPTIAKCSDPVIVVATIIGVTLAIGWRSTIAMIFAVILALVPLLFYLMLGPITFVLILLIVNPLFIFFGMRLLFPQSRY